MLLSEFLARHAPDYVPARQRRKVLVQMHCHHRAIFNMKDEVALLERNRGRRERCSTPAVAAWPVRMGSSGRATTCRRPLPSACCCRRSVLRSRIRSSWPTGSAVASRSRRTPIGARFTLRKYWQGGYEDETHIPRRQSRTPSAVPRTVDWPGGGAGSTPGDCRHDGGRQSVSRSR